MKKLLLTALIGLSFAGTALGIVSTVKASNLKEDSDQVIAKNLIQDFITDYTLYSGSATEPQEGTCDDLGGVTPYYEVYYFTKEAVSVAVQNIKDFYSQAKYEKQGLMLDSSPSFDGNKRMWYSWFELETKTATINLRINTGEFADGDRYVSVYSFIEEGSELDQMEGPRGLR